MKKGAVIPSKGIGDGLIMMVAAYALYQHGFDVTVYHSSLSSLKDWFFPVTFADRNSIIMEQLYSYDKLIVQNDNSPSLATFKQLQKEGSMLHILYPTYEKRKHSLTENDLVLEPRYPIAQGVGRAMRNILNDPLLSHDNGLIFKQSLSYRKHKKRVILHPASTDPDRTWPSNKFLKVYRLLEKKGYQPIFVISPHEREQWQPVEKEGFQLLSFSSLSLLADFLYESGFLIGNESGLSHLASNLHLPTVVIAGLKKRILQWRPGWQQGQILYPSPLIPNFKFLRLRDRYWKTWISSSRALSSFFALVALLNENE